MAGSSTDAKAADGADDAAQEADGGGIDPAGEALGGPQRCVPVLSSMESGALNELNRQTLKERGSPACFETQCFLQLAVFVQSLFFLSNRKLCISLGEYLHAACSVASGGSNRTLDDAHQFDVNERRDARPAGPHVRPARLHAQR